MIMEKNNISRVKEFIVKTGVVCMVFGFTVAILCIGGRDIILDAFISNEAIRTYGRKLIFGCMVSAPVYAIYQVSVTFLQGTERAMISTVVALLRQGIILMPVMIVLYTIGGFDCLVLCFAVTDILAAAAGAFCLAGRILKLSSISV